MAHSVRAPASAPEQSAESADRVPAPVPHWCRRPAPVSPAGWLTAPWRSAARQESRTTVRPAVPLALPRAWGKTDTAPPRFDRLAQLLRYHVPEHSVKPAAPHAPDRAVPGPPG